MVQELIRELAQRGITLGLSDGRLIVNAPPGQLADTLRIRIRESRDALIGELAKLDARSAANAVDPITPQPDQAHLPFALSDLQLGFYMADDPYMEFHVRPHCYMEMDRRGLDVARYQAAWNKALKRHELGFCVVDSELQLRKLSSPPVIEIVVNDFRGLSEAEAEARLLAIRERLERRELPLDRWPWIDLMVSLWKEQGAERCRIHYNHNSFFIDGYATTQFLAEVDKYYEQPELLWPPRSLSYRDAVLAIRALESGPAGEHAKQYWLAMLGTLPAPPPLPQLATLDRRRRSRLGRRSGVLTMQQWAAFKANAHRHRLTPSNAIIAAYAHVIAVWSGSEHFIFSQMVTRRFAELHPEIKTLIGNFASLYPLEIRLDRALSFATNAASIQDRVMQDIEHLQYGGMQVLQELNRRRGGFGAAPSPMVVGSGLFMKEYHRYDYVVLETSQTLLDHQFFELPDGSYYFVWDLLEEFFPAQMIDAMERAFACVLERLCRTADEWTQPLRYLVADADLAARRQCNRSQVPLHEPLLHRPLCARALEHPGQVAIKHAQTELTYEALNQWSDTIAARLIRYVMLGKKNVAVVMPRCCATVAAVMGILKAGAAYVPIDPELPSKRREYLLNEIGAGVVLTLPALVTSITWPAAIEVMALDAHNISAAFAAGPKLPDVAADDLGYIIFTSGTTGVPKGVMIEHRAAMNTIEDINRRFEVGRSDRLFGVSAFNFDLSVYDIFGAVAAGATLIYPDMDAALDPLHWLDVMIEEEVTVWNSVPALMSLLVEAAQVRSQILPSLRLVLLSGDKIPANLPGHIYQVAPNARVVALGGATEAAIWSIFYPLEKQRQYEVIPYGYPLANQRWHLHDRLGHDAPAWVVGELLIAGDGLARGYYNDEIKTARSFVTDLHTGERLYRTGDLGRYLPDGCLEILGRIDHQVKVHGHRIELGEIEAVLHRHAAVKQAVVLMCESALGQGRQLVAYVCCSSTAEHLVSQLEAHLRQELPPYMIPQQWLFLDELPRTANGKIDREALAALEAGTQEKELLVRTHIPPSGMYEEALAAVWQQVLRIEPIGATDDFFGLGGQSFDAIRIFSQINNRFGTSLNLGDMWQARTIAALAEQIARQPDQTQSKALVAMNRGKRAAPLFLVHPAGGEIVGYASLAQLLERPVYAFQARWRAEAAALPRNVAAVAAHYVRLLLETQPKGPYTLGGWSSGGAVAFEMALQLEQRGCVVEQLLLLDAPLPHSHGAISSAKFIRWFMEDLALDLPIEKLPAGVQGPSSLAAVLAAAVETLQPYSRSHLSHAQLLPIFQVFVDMITLVEDYTPGTLAGDITLIRARDAVVGEFADHPYRDREDWGWRPFTTGRMVCVAAPGNHYSFLRPPQLQSWLYVFNGATPSTPGAKPASTSCSSC